MTPFETLTDEANIRVISLLTPELERLHGGPLSFHDSRDPDRPRVIACWVESADGIISYSDIPGSEGGNIIAGGFENDRFLVALLRTVADARLFGRGTLHMERDGIGTPQDIYPEGADLLTAARVALGKPKETTSVLVTQQAEIPVSANIFHIPDVRNVIYTHEASVGKLRTIQQHENTTVTAFAPGDFERSILVDLKREHGIDLLLIEGGPTVWGSFMQYIDEIFITVSPRLVGNTRAAARPTPIQGVLFDPKTSPQLALTSVKKGGDFLFLRYSQK
ncbi:MAG: dihydrofolate reductase family protein [Patescibacteria group bacterium]